MTVSKPISLISPEGAACRIYAIRGMQVMLDFELAQLYGTTTKAFNQAVKRNAARFPEDFMFQVTSEEFQELNWSQFVTTSQKFRKDSDLPYAFTEQGVAMLSSVLRSERAIEMNIAIMRAFVEMRRAMLSHAELAEKLEAMEQKYDDHFRIVFEAIRELMTPPEPPKKQRMGFLEEKRSYCHG